MAAVPARCCCRMTKKWKKIMPRKNNLLTRLKQKYRRPLTLTGRYYKIARRMLLDTSEILNTGGINYFLDAGGLLGLVRDGDLIPWDDDLDLSMPVTELPKFRKLYSRLKRRGWRITEDSLMPADGPCWRKGDPRSIKIRNRNFLYFGRGRIVMDITLTYKHEGYYWRGAIGKIWRIPAKFYDDHDYIEFAGQQIRIPGQVEQYLALLYGDWKVPKKDHDPVKNDGSLYDDLVKP
ncbi:MAG: hypothetical protein DSY90_12405 [Deltaproteobacteria bacterium]|nr:MAG: hypothetical protein DSY90_12405 [Deltaproteobacteria bacterium]